MARLKNLKKLVAHHNLIDNANILVTQTKLRYLDLAHNRISNFSFLTSLQELKWLDISENPISSEVQLNIAEALDSLVVFNPVKKVFD